MPVEVATLQIIDPDLVEWIKKNPLFKYRVQQQWSLRIVAAKVGCSQTTVSKWEDGSSYPTDENMIKIAEVMKMSVEDLATLWRDWYQLKHKKDDNKNGN